MQLDNQNKNILYAAGLILLVVVLYNLSKKAKGEDQKGKDYTVTNSNGQSETFKPESFVRDLENEIYGYRSWFYYEVEPFKNIAELDNAKINIVSKEWDRLILPKYKQTIVSALQGISIWSSEVDKYKKIIISKLS
jgi:hypothetical protein